MRKIKEYISNGKTTVDLIIHEKANNEQLSNEAILLSDFWKRTVCVRKNFPFAFVERKEK